jgi:hypothetical protein
MKITDISVTLLANPDLDPYACDSAQDAVLVEIATDEGSPASEGSMPLPTSSRRS